MHPIDDVAALNAGYVADLYERYRRDPTSVDPSTRAYFSQSPPAGDAAGAAPAVPYAAVVGAVNLAHAVRAFGHLAARLDPLGADPIGDSLLEPSTHGVSEADLRQLPPGI